MRKLAIIALLAGAIALVGTGCASYIPTGAIVTVEDSVRCPRFTAREIRNITIAYVAFLYSLDRAAGMRLLPDEQTICPSS